MNKMTQEGGQYVPRMGGLYSPRKVVNILRD